MSAKRARTSSTLLTIVAITLATRLVTPTNTHALDIIPQLQDEGQNPSFDSNGTRLLAIFNAAAQIWERLLPFDSNEYEIDVSWGDLSNGTLGQHTFDFGGDNNIRMDPTPRQSDGDVLNWFIDPSPNNHSEFDFSNPDPATPNSQGMTLYADLSSSQKSSWFFGTNPPDVLEVGYRGAAIGTLPPEGSTAGSQGTVDMLSVVLHEIGHELGINSGDIEDGWEFKPQHILSTANVNIDETDDDAGGHFKATMTLMNQVTPSSTRVLPTATDVLAVAWDEDIDLVDLQRKHFGFNTSNEWNDPANWIGRRVPVSDATAPDEAYLMHGATVFLTAAASANSLTLDNNSDLTTNANTITVTGLTTLNPNSDINVPTGGHAILTSLNIADASAGLNMQGGSATIGSATNNAASGITGHGTVTVTTLLTNNGSIVSITDDLTINGPGSVDLDGDSNNGDVVAFSDLTINAPITDTFNGNMVAGEGATISIPEWTLGSTGTLLLDGDNNTTAPTTTLTSPPGATVSLRGDVTIDAFVVIASHNAQFHAPSTVSLPNTKDTLRLTSPGVTNFRGADFTGNGEVEQQSNIQVVESTTIATNEFDWGNSTTSTQRSLTVFPSQTLTIDSTTSTHTNNQFRGDLTLNSGHLAVNFDDPWELPDDIDFVGGLLFPAAPGRLFLNNTTGVTPTISGQELTINHVVVVSGGPARIDAPVVTTPNTNILVNPGATLAFAGPTEINAGFYNGDGTIQQLADFTSLETTVINTQTYDWGNSSVLIGTNSTTIAKDTQFIVLAKDTGTPGNPYHGVFNIHGGQLHTEFDDPWTLPDVDGSGPTAKPRGVINFPFNLFGASDTSHITGAPGQQMIVHGDINLLNVRAEIHADSQFHPAAAVKIGEAGTVEDATLALYGHAEFFGGAFTGPGTIEQAGNISILADTNFDNNEFDWGNSSLSLAEPPNQLTVGPNATFTVDTPVLGDATHSYRGVINITGGHLAINTLGQWTLLEQNLSRGGTLNFLNNTAPSKLSGQPLFVEGHVHVQADLAILDNATTFFDDAQLDFADTPTLEIGPTGSLELHTINIDHADADATITSDPTGSLTWATGNNITIQGNSPGSLTLALATGTAVGITSFSTPTLTIDPGATLHIAGQADPLTASGNPDIHMPVINNSTTSLNVSNPNVTTTTITGTGHTHVLNGGQLSVAHIAQDRITTDPGGTLTINAPSSSLNATSAFTNIGTFIITGSTNINAPTAGAGDFIAPTGTNMRFNLPVTASGNFPGPGTISFRQSYRPNGNAYGTNNFGGTVALSTTHILTLDVKTPLFATDTPTPGNDFDQLNITGPASLNGTLQIEFTPGGLFGDGLPPVGTEFPIMTYATRDPGLGPTMFATITGTLINSSFALAPLFTDTDDALILQALVPGDVDGNLAVNVADLAVFALNFGTTLGLYDEVAKKNSWERGDFNADGAVTVVDLSLLALNFGFALNPDGATTPPTPLSLTDAAGLAGLDISTIPEPATATLVLIPLAVAHLIRRRRPTPAV